MLENAVALQGTAPTHGELLRSGNIVLNERSSKFSIYCVLPKIEMGGNLGTCMEERFSIL